MRVLATGEVVEIVDSEKLGDFGTRYKTKISDGILDEGARKDGYWIFYRNDSITPYQKELWNRIKKEYQSYLQALAKGYRHLRKVRKFLMGEKVK